MTRGSLVLLALLVSLACWNHVSAQASDDVTDGQLFPVMERLPITPAAPHLEDDLRDKAQRCPFNGDFEFLNKLSNRLLMSRRVKLARFCYAKALFMYSHPLAGVNEMQDARFKQRKEAFGSLIEGSARTLPDSEVSSLAHVADLMTREAFKPFDDANVLQP